jgi:hypothetical protein
VLLEIAAALDRLGLEWLLGGSLASSILGEPRSSLDIDLAIELRVEHIERLTREVDPSFFIDPEAGREAIRRRTSFNVIHRETMMKVDLFVLGDTAFDREQLSRRRATQVSPGSSQSVPVSSPEDLVLRKLAWFRAAGGVSDRQWRDVLGILKVQSGRLDMAYLQRWAESLALTELLERALREAAGSG